MTQPKIESKEEAKPTLWAKIREYFKNVFWVVLSVFLLLAGCFGAIYTLTVYVQDTARKTVTSPEILNEIARKVKPYAIFDQNSSVLLDMGAFDHLEKITVEMKDEWEGKIIVKPKHYLAQAPLIERIGGFDLDFKQRRGEGFDWIYEFGRGGSLGGESWELKFRIEILK